MRKVEHLASFWKWAILELESGLLLAFSGFSIKTCFHPILT